MPNDIRFQNDIDDKIKEAEELAAQEENQETKEKENGVFSDTTGDSGAGDKGENLDDLDDLGGDKEKPPQEKPQEKPETKESEPDEKDGHGQSYRDKYLASTREALVQKSQNERYLEKIEEANNLPEPTDEEMKAAYNTWDDMDEIQKSLAREAYHTKRYREIVGSLTQEKKQKSEWLQKSEEFITDPQTLERYPQVRGKEKEFLKFVSKDSRINMNFDDAVNAFSYGLAQQTKPKHKGSLLNTATGGEKPEEKPMELKDIRTIRQKDPKQYQKLVAEGKIDPLANL